MKQSKVTFSNLTKPVTVTLGGRSWVVVPQSADHFRAVMDARGRFDHLARGGDSQGFEMYDAFVEFAKLALLDVPGAFVEAAIGDMTESEGTALRAAIDKNILNIRRVR